MKGTLRRLCRPCRSLQLNSRGSLQKWHSIIKTCWSEQREKRPRWGAHGLFWLGAVSLSGAKVGTATLPCLIHHWPLERLKRDKCSTFWVLMVFLSCRCLFSKILFKLNLIFIICFQSGRTLLGRFVNMWFWLARPLISTPHPCWYCSD